MNSTLLCVGLFAYFVSTIFYLVNLHIKQPRLVRYGNIAVSIGFLLQSARLLVQGIKAGSPFITPSEALFFLSWAIIAAYLVTLARYRLAAVGALAVPLSMIALALAFRFRGVDDGEFVTCGWITLHVYSIVISLSMFALAFCCAVFYLIQNKLLKRKKLTGMFRKLPPLEKVDNLAFGLVAIGFPILTLGIITGFAGVEFGLSNFGESTLQLFVAVLTWIIYAVYLLSRTMARWKGKRSNWILIAGAASIVLTTGIHNFI